MHREGDLSTKGQDLSTEGETRLLRGRLVYGGGDSSIEGKTRLRRGRLVHRGGDSSTEGEILPPAATSSYLSSSSGTIFSYLFWKCSSPAPEVPGLSVITVSADLQIRKTFYSSS